MVQLNRDVGCANFIRLPVSYVIGTKEIDVPIVVMV